MLVEGALEASGSALRLTVSCDGSLGDVRLSVGPGVIDLGRDEYIATIASVEGAEKQSSWPYSASLKRHYRYVPSTHKGSGWATLALLSFAEPVSALAIEIRGRTSPRLPASSLFDRAWVQLVDRGDDFYLLAP